jgi:hypothetical protein
MVPIGLQVAPVQIMQPSSFDYEDKPKIRNIL